MKKFFFPPQTLRAFQSSSPPMIACASFADCATCSSLAMQEPSHCNCGERYSFNEARMLAAYTLHCHYSEQLLLLAAQHPRTYLRSPPQVALLASSPKRCSPPIKVPSHHPSLRLHNASHQQKLTLHPLSRQCHSCYSETLFLSVRGIHFRIRVTFLTALRAHSGQTSALAIIIDYGQSRSLSNRPFH